MEKVKIVFLHTAHPPMTPVDIELGCDHILRTYFERDSESNEVDTDVEVRIAE